MIRIAQFTFNPFGEQTYVVHDAATREAAIIDPGCLTPTECASLSRHIADEGLTVRLLLATHHHLDHVAGTAYCARTYGIGLSGSLDEQLALPTLREQAFLFGLDEEFATAETAPVVHRLAEGDRLTLGEHQIDVLDVPGHSPHGLCFYFASEKALFSGDVLFCGSVGRSDFGEGFGCSHRSLVEGITSKLLTLPPDVAVYPGHGPQTTIGIEASVNPYL